MPCGGDCELVRPLWNSLEVELRYHQQFYFWVLIRRISRHQFIHPHAHASIIYNSRDLEVTGVSVSRRLDKEAVAPTDDGLLLLGHEKEWNVAVCGNMGGSGG